MWFHFTSVVIFFWKLAPLRDFVWYFLFYMVVFCISHSTEKKFLQVMYHVLHYSYYKFERSPSQII